MQLANQKGFCAEHEGKNSLVFCLIPWGGAFSNTNLVTLDDLKTACLTFCKGHRLSMCTLYVLRMFSPFSCSP